MTKTTTITEAMAELKVIAKRLQSKEQFVLQYLARDEQLKDPLVKEAGGAAGEIQRQLQAITDLREDQIRIKRAIEAANAITFVTVEDHNRCIAEWLIWKRDVAPSLERFTKMTIQKIEQARAAAKQRGGALVSATANATETKPQDVLINVDERALQAQSESLAAMLEFLDGQLSLKNATTQIEY